MSKKCPWCKVDVYLTEIKHWWRCPACQTEFPERAFPKESTIFDHITTSPEVLAEKLVYSVLDEDGCEWWASTLCNNIRWERRSGAFYATLERLKEVER